MFHIGFPPAFIFFCLVMPLFLGALSLGMGTTQIFVSRMQALFFLVYIMLCVSFAVFGFGVGVSLALLQPLAAAVGFWIGRWQLRKELAGS